MEDDFSSAQYDPSSGYLTLTLSKVIPGQEFKDLDLLVKLLAPRPAVPQPLIEVISEDQASNKDQDLIARTEALSLERDEILQAAQNDWQLPQSITEIPLDITMQKQYGFLDLHSGYFKHVAHTENEVNELESDAESCTVSQRRERRLRHENDKWDEEYYTADYADDEQIIELLKWKHPYAANTGNFHYTDEENAAMLRLPRKEYLPTSTQTHNLYLTLLSLLFSYAYECRTTQHDPTPESAWTLATLIPAFSALDPPNLTVVNPLVFSTGELSQILATSYRRSLAFPLYRSWILAEACRMDVAQLLSKGKRTVVRCLLEMKNILDHHEVYYVYSKIWLDDFCVWTQAYASDDVMVSLGRHVSKLEMNKALIGWNIEQLEAAADLGGAEERDSDSDDETSDGSNQ